MNCKLPFSSTNEIVDNGTETTPSTDSATENTTTSNVVKAEIEIVDYGTIKLDFKKVVLASFLRIVHAGLYYCLFRAGLLLA